MMLPAVFYNYAFQLIIKQIAKNNVNDKKIADVNPNFNHNASFFIFSITFKKARMPMLQEIIIVTSEKMNAENECCIFIPLPYQYRSCCKLHQEFYNLQQ